MIVCNTIMTDLNLLLQSRVEFFRRYHPTRETDLFLTNESRYLTLLTADRNANLLNSLRISLTSLPVQSFFDPVTVAATNEQMTAAFTPVSTVPEGLCPICQESFTNTNNAVTLRRCNHTFHRDCAQTWYHTSVYCPICRDDIRAS
jgi:hypothetical protein